jgi:hypothetical protein
MRSDEFKRHIVEMFDLEERDFTRLLEEFLGHFGSTVEEYVRNRHRELQREGRKNEEIFSIIASEVHERRFAAEPLTVRRIRRMIYG